MLDTARALLVTGLSGLATLAFSGCVARQPPLTQAQMNAIETREVDATLDQTYRAASSALFDAGYTIAMSDRSAGLLTGERGIDRSAERAWNSYVQDTKFRMSMQIMEMDSQRTSVRIKTSVNGESRTDQRAIDQVWVLMQRQVMMKEPPVLP